MPPLDRTTSKPERPWPKGTTMGPVDELIDLGNGVLQLRRSLYWHGSEKHDSPHAHLPPNQRSRGTPSPNTFQEKHILHTLMEGNTGSRIRTYISGFGDRYSAVELSLCPKKMELFPNTLLRDLRTTRFELVITAWKAVGLPLAYIRDPPVRLPTLGPPSMDHIKNPRKETPSEVMESNHRPTV